MKLGDLQQLTWHHFYDRDFENKGNLRAGWTLVLIVRDISQILDGPLPQSTQVLHKTWKEFSPGLGNSGAAKEAIIAAPRVPSCFRHLRSGSDSCCFGPRS